MPESTDIPDTPTLLRVTVVLALPDRQPIVALTLQSSATVQDAVERSGLLRRFPELTRQSLACAIYSRPVELSALLRDGDRVEILRPLLIDPKEQRRQAAHAQKKSA